MGIGFAPTIMNIHFPYVRKEGASGSNHNLPNIYHSDLRTQPNELEFI